MKKQKVDFKPNTYFLIICKPKVDLKNVKCKPSQIFSKPAISVV